MKIQYFADTDTLYILLNENRVDETRDLDENTLLDLDSNGQLVGLTIEHAQTRVKISSFSFEQIASNPPSASTIIEKQLA